MGPVITLLLTLGVGAAALLLLVEVVGRWPTTAIAAGCVLVSVSAAYPVLPTLLSLAGASVYPTDLLLGVLAADLILHRRAPARPLAKYRAWLAALAILCILSALRGLTVNGTGPALNEVREFALLLLAVIWTAKRLSADDDFAERLWTCLRLLGIVLVFVATAHALTRGFGTVDGMIQQDDQLVTDRILVSSQALVLALIGLFELVVRRSSFASALGVGFIVVAVLSQHRSVWAALAVGVIAAVVAARPGPRGRILVGLFGTAMIATATYATGTLDPLLEKLVYGFESRQTFEARASSWDYLVDQQRAMGVLTNLIGQPFGAGWTRPNYNGGVVEFGPHNWYVQLYLRVGILGVLAVLAILLRTLARAIVAREAWSAGAVAGVGVYAIVYSLPWFVGVLLGMAIVRCADREHAAPGSHSNTKPTPPLTGRQQRRRVSARPAGVTLSPPTNHVRRTV